MEIKGSWFLWIGLIIGGVLWFTGTEWYKVYKEGIIELVCIVYIIWNIIGLLTMIGFYKGDDKSSHKHDWYWDLDLWIHTGEINEKCPNARNDIFRLTSIACYVIWGLMLLNRYFNEEFTIKIKKDEKDY